MDEEVEYGPYEYYHNDKNEPMFRQWKIRNLSSLFENEEDSSEYTLEQFKEWLKGTCPEEDWSYIHIWGRLSCFLRYSFLDFRIFEYLFQLGMDPFYIYISSIEDIEYCEEDLKNPTCECRDKTRLELVCRECRDTTIRTLEEAKELLNICSKYISPDKIKLALELKGNTDFI